jgi:hypothetical protein
MRAPGNFSKSDRSRGAVDHRRHSALRSASARSAGRRPFRRERSSRDGRLRRKAPCWEASRRRVEYTIRPGFRRTAQGRAALLSPERRAARPLDLTEGRLPTGRKSRQRWWDKVENKQWDSMGRLARVGHDNLLIGLVSVAPSTGTKATLWLP